MLIKLPLNSPVTKHLYLFHYKIEKNRIPKKAQHGNIENVAGSV
jgi:hypothetical protein